MFASKPHWIDLLRPWTCASPIGTDDVEPTALRFALTRGQSGILAGVYVWSGGEVFLCLVCLLLLSYEKGIHCVILSYASNFARSASMKMR